MPLSSKMNRVGIFVASQVWVRFMGKDAGLFK